MQLLVNVMISHFRDIGQKEFLLRIASVILKQPSVHAPNRRKRLQTFAERKIINQESCSWRRTNA